MTDTGNGRVAKSGSENGQREDNPKRIGNQRYASELFRLQLELVKMVEWIKHKKLKVVVIFEGRDAAGKGGVIKLGYRLTGHRHELYGTRINKPEQD